MLVFKRRPPFPRAAFENVRMLVDVPLHFPGVMDVDVSAYGIQTVSAPAREILPLDTLSISASISNDAYAQAQENLSNSAYRHRNNATTH